MRSGNLKYCICLLKGKFGALKKRLNEHLKEIMEGDSEGSEEPDIYQGMYS